MIMMMMIMMMMEKEYEEEDVGMKKSERQMKIKMNVERCEDRDVEHMMMVSSRSPRSFFSFYSCKTFLYCCNIFHSRDTVLSCL